MNNHFRIPAALLLALVLSGCGQTGPLYVSGNPSTIQPAAEQPATDEDEEGKAAESDNK